MTSPRRREANTVFGNLPGQDAVVAQLEKAAAAAAALLAGGRSPGGGDRGGRPPGPVQPGAMTHAWLFTGPPGSGRSVAARSFAAALLCPSGGCGQCASCHQVQAGTHADLMLIRPEGLSYGVKQTRDLVLRAAGQPTGGRWQVVLFEDADRCTEQAANALLKAIEEPAPGRSGCCARRRPRTWCRRSGPGAGLSRLSCRRRPWSPRY